MKTIKFKKGMKVKVWRLDKTKKRFSLDSNGRMLEMQGHIFSISSIDSDRVKIYYPPANQTFIFDPSDILPVPSIDSLPPLPEPAMFDEKELDI